MPSSVEPDWVERILRHLGEISVGRCSIDERMVESEPSEEMRRLLVALMLVHEDQVYANEQRERAEQGREKVLAELRSAIVARDEFLAVASHELRTPVTIFGLELEMLEPALEHPDALEKVCSRSIPRLRRQLDRLTGLIDQMLDVSRITAGRLELSPRELDLAELTEEVIDRFRPSLERRGVVLTSELERPMLGRWDGPRIDQVLTNLLSNAIKYGEGTPIEVNLHAESQRALLSVRDHGIGISPADRARLFVAFERGESSRNYAGLGLGLWISQQIARASGGEIHVEDVAQPGACFVLELPR